MNRPQTDSERKCQVTRDYQAEFSDPIAVEAGEAFAVSERTSAWENNAAWIWIWCTDQRGKSGFVPKNIIQMDAGGQSGSAHAAYNAIELTVTVGQELVIEDYISSTKAHRCWPNYALWLDNSAFCACKPW